MAGLTWLDVVVIGLVATIGFTLLAYAYSALMARKNWTYQAKAKPNPGRPSGQPPGEPKGEGKPPSPPS